MQPTTEANMTPAHRSVPESDAALRVRALESLLAEKGLIDPKALDALVDTYETKIGPRNGAKVVARAWVDPAYKQRLLSDATAAIKEFGTELPDTVEVRTWDTTAEVRYLVLPQRPAGTDTLSEDQLAELVTRDAMIGVTVLAPTQPAPHAAPTPAT
jgi:hypothetical protein